LVKGTFWGATLIRGERVHRNVNGGKNLLGGEEKSVKLKWECVHKKGWSDVLKKVVEMQESGLLGETNICV